MTDFDSILAHELKLYADTFSSVHYNGIGRTLSKFWLKDTFNYDRALGYVYRNLVLPAAKDYHLCCGSLTQVWHTMFTIPERKQAAECILNDFIAEFRVGNFWE